MEHIMPTQFDLNPEWKDGHAVFVLGTVRVTLSAAEYDAELHVVAPKVSRGWSWYATLVWPAHAAHGIMPGGGVLSPQARQGSQDGIDEAEAQANAVRLAEEMLGELHPRLLELVA